MKLGDVCNVRRGTTITKKDTKKGDIPVIAGGRKATYYHNKSNRKSFIITISGSGASAGLVNYWEIPIFASDCTTVETKDENQNIKFVFYYLQSIQDYIYKNLRFGAAQPHVYAKDIAKINFPFVPIEKQKYIVQKLDTVFAEIDKTIVIINSKEQEIISFFKKILSEEFKSSSKIKKLNEVCKIYNGGTPDTKNTIYWGGEIQWLTPKDMGKLKNEFVTTTLRQLTEDGLKNSSANLIPNKSIILSCRAPIGHLAINNVPMAFNQGCKGLVADPKILHFRYLYYFLLSSKKLLNDLGKGTTFKEISSKVLSSVEINVPSLDIQKKIINKLDQIFNDLQKLRDINREQIENYLKLKNAIINKEIKIKAA